MQWYYAQEGRQSGPVDEAELIAMAQSGRLRPFDLVWNETLGEQWVETGSLPMLAVQLQPVLPRYPAVGGPPPAGAEITARAREALRGRWGLSVGFVVLFYLLFAGLSVVAAAVPAGALLVQFLLTPPLMVGAVRFFLSVARREPEASMNLMFFGFRLFGSSIGANLLLTIFIMLWSLLIIVPSVLAALGVAMASGLAVGEGLSETGRIVLMAVAVLAYVLILVCTTVISLRYAMTYFLVADKSGIGPLEAVRTSVGMMRGHKRRLFCLWLRFIGWSLLAMLTCGIGFLWLAPYMAVSMAAFYDDLAGRS